MKVLRDNKRGLVFQQFTRLQIPVCQSAVASSLLGASFPIPALFEIDAELPVESSCRRGRVVFGAQASDEVWVPAGVYNT